MSAFAHLALSPRSGAERHQGESGYVVGALHLRSGAVFDAFAVTFVRFDQGRTVASDTYASEWVADEFRCTGVHG
jgi:hypothetical protein